MYSISFLIISSILVVDQQLHAHFVSDYATCKMLQNQFQMPFCSVGFGRLRNICSGIHFDKFLIFFFILAIF